jgi:Cu+-exporting ATPase
MQIDPVYDMKVDETSAAAQNNYKAETQKVILPVQGMTCASCVNRVQTALDQVPGVIHASVNFATERATVVYSSGQATVEDLATAIASAGYKILEIDEEQFVDEEKAVRETEFKRLKRKFYLGVVLVAPLFILVHWNKLGLAGILPLSGQTNYLLQLLLQTPVQFWVGLQFY